MSSLWNLNTRDFLKGGVMFVLSAVVDVLIQSVSAGGIDSVDWSKVLNVAIVATLSYLLKNLATDQNGQVGGVL